MDVSVLIPAFNAANTVLRAVQSALEQNVELEVIVIDDCSTDDTLDRCKLIYDPRLRIIPLKKNLGPAGARNAGLMEAKGTWIAVLDADDFFLPDRLTELLKYGGDRNVTVIADNVWTLVEETRERNILLSEPIDGGSEDNCLKDFLLNNLMFRSESSFGYLKPLMRRDTLVSRRIQYPEELRIGEDFAIVCMLLADGCIFKRVRRAGYVYTRHAQSISHRISSREIEAIIQFDDNFATTALFNHSELQALARHRRFLIEGYRFVHVLERYKAKHHMEALALVSRHPSIWPLLKMPIVSRLERFLA